MIKESHWKFMLRDIGLLTVLGEQTLNLAIINKVSTQFFSSGINLSKMSREVSLSCEFQNVSNPW